MRQPLKHIILSNKQVGRTLLMFNELSDKLSDMHGIVGSIGVDEIKKMMANIHITPDEMSHLYTEDGRRIVMDDSNRVFQRIKRRKLLLIL